MAVTGKQSVILLVEASLDGEKLLINEDDVSQRAFTKLPQQESGPCRPVGLRCCAEQLPLLYGRTRKTPVTRRLIVHGDIPCSLITMHIDCRGFLRILSLIVLIATGVRQNSGLPGLVRSSVDWVSWNLHSVRLMNIRLSFISFPG